jgi:ATP-binding cassette, subfamily B, bacterial MsbA
MNSLETLKSPLSGKEQFLRLMTFVRPYRWRLVVILVLVVLGSLLGLAGPYAFQFLIDAVLEQNDQQLLNQITVIMIIIFALQSVIYFFRTYLLSFLGERVMTDMRIHLFDHLQSLSLSFYNAHRTGELVSRLTNDVSTVRVLVTTDITTALSQSITFVGALAIILYTNWRLTLFMFALIPIVLVAAIWFGKKLRPISTAVQDQLASTTTVMEEVLGGIRVVQSFTREPYESDRFTSNIERAFNLAMRRARLSSMFGPIISFLGFAAVVSIFWFGGREVLAGRLTSGQLFMFLVLTLTIASSIGSLSGLWTSLQEALGATNRIFDLLDTSSTLTQSPTALPLPPIQGHIIFDEVSFSYQDASEDLILCNINLEIQPGEVLALVGPSGAGKTTLANLIPRFFDPTSGRILVDGQDLRDVELAGLRRQIGIVPQETLLFGGTVRENIQYGRLEASQEEIETAARAANAHEFIQELPQGYETVVGERGARLSGGQKQRIAIARAILKNPSILLLDEATSSLDSESEGQVQQALERLMQNRTSIIIAHRLSTIQNAHRIAVLEEGELVELGTHAELLASEGLYAHLHSMQFGQPETLPVQSQTTTPENVLTKKNRPQGLLSRFKR